MVKRGKALKDYLSRHLLLQIQAPMQYLGGEVSECLQGARFGPQQTLYGLPQYLLDRYES
jgi:hypothetical protein